MTVAWLRALALRRYEIERDMRRRKSWLIAIYGAILRILALHYSRLATVIDFQCAPQDALRTVSPVFVSSVL